MVSTLASNPSNGVLASVAVGSYTLEINQYDHRSDGKGRAFTGRLRKITKVAAPLVEIPRPTTYRRHWQREH